jgi:hypothetical protein
MSSSQNQHSDEPSGVLGALVAAFVGFLFGSLFSRQRTPDDKSIYSDHTQDNTDKGAQRRLRLVG